MQKLKIRKIGNSLGAIFNAELVTRLNVQEGDELLVRDEADGVKITPYDPVFERAMVLLEQGSKEYRNALRKLAE